MSDKYYHVRVEDSIRNRFQGAVPWGFQGAVMEELMNLFVDLGKKHGELTAVALLLEKHARIEIKEQEDAST